MEYRARIKQDEGSWIVDFPDCPGCQTYGASREEALTRGQEALEGWLEAGLDWAGPSSPSAAKGTPIRIGARLEVARKLPSVPT